MVSSREELDRALDRVRGDAERIADALVAMDAHPAHRVLGAATGVTAARWVDGGAAMASLWDEYRLFGDVLRRAEEVRGRRAKPGDAELAELTELLYGPVVTLAVREVAIEHRGLTGPAEVAERITLADLVERMRGEYDRVTAVLAAVEAAWTAAVAELDAADRRISEADRLAAAVGSAAARVAELRVELDRLRAAVLADVLGAAAGEPAALARRADQLVAELSGLVAVRDRFDERLAALDAALAELEAVEATTRQTYAAVVAKILAPGLAVPDASGSAAVRARLDRLRAQPPGADWAAVAAETARLDAFAADRLAAARAALGTVAGILDRRAELRGRLAAYQAKAARLGRAEDLALCAVHDEAQTLLFTAPCDLAAATRALNRYRDAVSGARGTTTEGGTP